jgi:hypothetical protein
LLKRGTERKGAKLTDDDVRAIRRAAASGATGRSLADAYGISFGLACAVIRGERWRHVT